MRNFQVIKSGKAWALRRTGAKRALRVGMTREDAWAKAQMLARAAGVQAYLHDTDGRVQTRVV